MCSDGVHLLQVLNIPDLQTRIMEWFRWEKPSKITVKPTKAEPMRSWTGHPAPAQSTSALLPGRSWEWEMQPAGSPKPSPGLDPAQEGSQCPPGREGAVPAAVGALYSR